MKYLKIPCQCYSKSKDANLLNDVIFYYQIKSINDHGFFKNNTLIKQINQHTEYATSTIWRKVKRLQENHLMTKHNNGYHIASYDKLFNILNYDLTWNGKRKGNFKIHRIPLDQIDDVKSWLAYVDVRDNLNKQVKIAYKKLLKDKRYQYTGKSLHCASKKYKQYQLDQIAKSPVQMVKFNDDTKLAYQLSQANQRANQHDKMCNPDVTLSLKGICRILHLSNTSCAHKIIQRLKQFNMIDTIKRIAPYKTTHMSYQQYLKIAHKYLLIDGVLFRRLPNKLILGV